MTGSLTPGSAKASSGAGGLLVIYPGLRGGEARPSHYLA